MDMIGTIIVGFVCLAIGAYFSNPVKQMFGKLIAKIKELLAKK